MSTLPAQELTRYAELAVRVGLNLQPGQNLLVTAPIETAPLVRRVVESAYQAGARLVGVIWADDQLELIRYQYAPRDSFDEFPNWLAQAFNEQAERGDASLMILAQDPNLLKDQDPALIATAQKTRGQRLKPFAEAEGSNKLNWAIISAPIPSWAAQVFPNQPPEVQEKRLWDAIVKTCRLDQPDPVAVWRKHVEQLTSRRDLLNRKQYKALHLKAPGTDLTIGLPVGHIWGGGQLTTHTGITFTPNLPTEEVFVSPHRGIANGVVRSSKPLNYGGQLVENFSLTFSEGRVVNIRAEKGQAILDHLVETDDGARRLGEIALVPHSSPTSQSNLLFYNTLFDENAACHLALGRGFRFALQNGESMSDEEFTRAGGNDSLVHVDFMIGSDEMDVDGLDGDGAPEPILRRGEWAFEL